MAVERQAGSAGLSFSNSLRVQEPSGAWVYVSGQFGTDEAGAIAPGGLAAESKAALQNVLKAVSEAGGTAADVVKITAYLTSLDDYQRYNEVRRGGLRHETADEHGGSRRGPDRDRGVDRDRRRSLRAESRDGVTRKSARYPHR